MRKIISVIVTLILLLSLSMTAMAMENLQLPEWENQAESAASGTGSYTGDPVFLMLVVNRDDEAYLAIDAFLVYDENSQATYLLTTYIVEDLAEEGDKFVIYGDDDYAEEARYLGTFGRVACMTAPGLQGAKAYTLSDGIPNEIGYLYRSIDGNGVMDPILKEYGLNDGWTQSSDLFISNIEMDDSCMVGAPVFSMKNERVIGVGMLDGDGHLTIGSLAGSTLPVKYAVEVLDGTAEETEPEPAKAPAKEPGKSSGKTPSSEEEDSNLIVYVLAGAAALGVFYVYNKKKKAGTAAGSAAAVDIPLGPERSGNEAVLPPTINNSAAPFAEPPQSPATVMPEPSWRIRSLGGVLGGQAYLISGMVRLGRNPQCEVRFPEGTPGISGSHCQVIVSGDRAAICDVGSSYGTYLRNGVRLQPNQNYPLNPGDVFALGSPTGPSFVIEKRV